MIDRRRFLTAMAFAGFAATMLLVPRTLRARVGGALAPEAAEAAAQSPLIYVSPLLGDASESTCHAEVWFVVDGDDLLVVTPPDRWRAKAIAQGLDQARIWIGDYGVWTREPGKFRAAPTLVARARIDTDTAAHARALTAFGAKYSAEWPKWGPRFTDGLASGERVLIRYSTDTE